jgi:uncharacterized membrane protein YkoI
MIRRCRLAVAVTGAVLAALSMAPVSADDDDKEAAEAALRRGEARPLEDLLQRVRSEFAGSVLKIELEHEDDGEVPWLYEVKLLTPEGDVLELEYDAGTLELLGLEGRYREREDDD